MNEWVVEQMQSCGSTRARAVQGAQERHIENFSGRDFLDGQGRVCSDLMHSGVKVRWVLFKKIIGKPA